MFNMVITTVMFDVSVLILEMIMKCFVCMKHQDGNEIFLVKLLMQFTEV